MTVTHRQILAPLALLGALFLAGCNGTIGAIEPALSVASNNDDDGDVDKSDRRHIGKPYKVGGRWYHPKEDEDYDETGLASWYGKRFHGKRTANGELFDKDALTAAHPTLPLPSYVRVTVVETGKSAVVRVNDRGPFSHDRILDVSRAAAEELGFRRAGHANVRVEYMGPAPIATGSETLLAAKTETKPKAKSSGFSLFGGRNREKEEEKNISVRLAKAEPLTGEEKLPPGVSSRYAARRSAPAGSTLTAYAGEQKPSGALKAVTEIAEEPVVVQKPIKAQPLPDSATHLTADRFAGAHDMFASAGGISEVIAAANADAAAEPPAASDETEPVAE